MDSPANRAIFNIGSAVTVRYALQDNLAVAEHKLFVNAVQVTPTSLGSGRYSYVISALAAGDTTIRVEAADAAGNQTILVRTITGQPTPVAVSISKLIAASVDDWYTGGGVAPFFFPASTTNYLGWQGNYEHLTGHRYTDVQVEKRQQITTASDSAIAYGYHNGTQTIPGVAGVNPGISVRVRGVLGKNPANPTSQAEASALPKTTAFVDWAPTEWAQFSRYTTPDIAAIVQELVNQDTWVKGDSIVLVFGATTPSGATPKWLREWGFDRTSTPKGGQLALAAAASLYQSANNKLTWAPPVMTTPTTISVVPASGTYNLTAGQDYILNLGSTVITRALAVNGGRNVIIIGGEVAIPNQGDAPSISSRRGMKFQDQTGTVHIEGVLFRGDDISEGIQISAKQAIVQIQNCRIENIHARDQVNFTDNHPDLVQTYGSVGELRIDKFTGSTDYQGFLFQPDNNTGPHGPTIIKRTNIIGLPTARYLFWMNNRAGWTTVSLSEFYCDIPVERTVGFGKSLWPDTSAAAPNTLLVENVDGQLRGRWPNMLEPVVTGYVIEGPPPNGDFVPAASIGIGYVSPGYV